MARKSNDMPTRLVRISTTPQVIEYLERLVSTGLYGKNPAEAMDRLVSEKIRSLISSGELPPVQSFPDSARRAES